MSLHFNQSYEDFSDDHEIEPLSFEQFDVELRFFLTLDLESLVFTKGHHITNRAFLQKEEIEMERLNQNVIVRKLKQRVAKSDVCKTYELKLNNTTEIIAHLQRKKTRY